MNDDDELNQWLKTIAKNGAGDSPGTPDSGAPHSAATQADATPGQAGANATPAGAPDQAAVRARIQATFGQVVMSLCMIPRYRHQSLSDLHGLVLEPLLRDRIALAQTKSDDTGANIVPETSGIAFWASVSDEVDAKIREQVAAGVFPVRLKPDDWKSGSKIWLLDIIAPSPKVASAMMQNFQKFTKTSGDIQLHPVVARQVDPQLLKNNAANGAPPANPPDASGGKPG